MSVFVQHVPASKIGYHAACAANAEVNVRTAALLPMNAKLILNQSDLLNKVGPNENKFHSQN